MLFYLLLKQVFSSRNPGRQNQQRPRQPIPNQSIHGLPSPAIPYNTHSTTPGAFAGNPTGTTVMPTQYLPQGSLYPQVNLGQPSQPQLFVTMPIAQSYNMPGPSFQQQVPTATTSNFSASSIYFPSSQQTQFPGTMPVPYTPGFANTNVPTFTPSVIPKQPRTYTAHHPKTQYTTVRKSSHGTGRGTKRLRPAKFLPQFSEEENKDIENLSQNMERQGIGQGSKGYKLEENIYDLDGGDCNESDAEDYDICSPDTRGPRRYVDHPNIRLPPGSEVVRSNQPLDSSSFMETYSSPDCVLEHSSDCNNVYINLRGYPEEERPINLYNSDIVLENEDEDMALIKKKKTIFTKVMDTLDINDPVFEGNENVASDEYFEILKETAQNNAEINKLSGEAVRDALKAKLGAETNEWVHINDSYERNISHIGSEKQDTIDELMVNSVAFDQSAIYNNEMLKIVDLQKMINETDDESQKENYKKRINDIINGVYNKKLEYMEDNSYIVEKNEKLKAEKKRIKRMIKLQGRGNY
ncbi:hypothetical protein SLOPH_1062 [Spraguea lophii 42_110]|uniref:Uncharacterized protein n=1 Tax=Spraguea lophii (strain 42_110) TaxID=1358809 RepID=S7XRU9_SPRLO|nr:hypothetical protein SLOPH_1062 [Spraguea lophii 42_110]